MNVFLAEDDPLMSGIYEKALRLAGFDMTMALDGELAIEALKAADQKPAVVVLDIMMPKKSGLDVLAEMKKDDQLKGIPVVLLTNLAGSDDVKKGIELGAISYLVKSQVGPQEIADRVKEVYEKYAKK